MTQERPADAIQWHEGMMLAPQHFQQFGQRTDHLIAYHAAALSPAYWGLVRLRIDESLLVGGIVRILDLEAVMPDGLIVHHSPADGDLDFDLATCKEALEDGPMLLHLAVLGRGRGGNDGEGGRYASVEGPAVADENTGEGALVIPRLHPRLRLMAGDVPPSKFVSFPLLEVALRDETYGLTDFVAPCLRLPAVSSLGSALAAVARRLREKAVFLAERARAPGAGGEAMTLEGQMVIRGLVAALPPLEVLATGDVAHPFQVYLALSALTGQLAVLGAGQVPPVPPPYRHNDLRGCFRPLLDFALRRIDGIQMQYREVAFSREPGAFFLVLKEAWLRPRLIIGARRRSGQSDAEIRHWVEKALIASLDHIASLSERRVLGARRAQIERDEQLGVIPTERVTLFAIELDPALIQADAPLIVSNRIDMKMEGAPADLVLYVANTGEGA